ncbi:MAG TPA: DegV family protein [Acidimicrobiales bacterium]|nr:DegV family protein [Acidimicrobiales bacterium]
MAVRVVTDSACDLTDEEAAALGVEVVPLTIRFGADEYVDRKDLSPAEFYAKLAAADVLPETAAPSPGAFEAAFRSALDGGAEAVVCINISSGLSATMQSAQNAARALEGHDIRLVDSRSITWGLGSQVVAAAEAARDGRDAAEIVALVEGMVPRTRVYGALDTLDNLRKGGRIGGAQAMIGSLLSIKPLIDISTGVVEEAGKPRTRSKALKALVEKVAEQPQGVERLGLMHGNAPDELDQVLDMLAEHHPRDQIHVGEIGATIGVHGGARVMGVTFQVPSGT